MTKSSVSEIPGFVAGTWRIDPVCSKIAFVSRHFVFSKAHGSFDRLAGTIVTHEEYDRSFVTATIDASSIRTTGPKRDSHCRSAHFLDVQHFPTISFQSTAIHTDGRAFYVAGDLNIRGAAQPTTLVMERWGFAPDFDGRTRAYFSATAEISRNDFGLRPKGALELVDNAFVLSDTVTVTLKVDAVLERGQPKA
jgi:polyisoprenoid-binding protein YceI